MLIVTVAFTTTPETRAQTVAALQAEAPLVRALPGNLGYAPGLDAETPGGVQLTHRWTDATAFAGYCASGGFAAVGAAVFPLVTCTSVSEVFEAAPHCG